MNADLDSSARDAAAAARASVTRLTGAATPRPALRAGLRRLVLAGSALIVVALVALAGLGDDVTTVTTCPADQSPGMGSAPPGSPPRAGPRHRRPVRQ